MKSHYCHYCHEFRPSFQQVFAGNSNLLQLGRDPHKIFLFLCRHLVSNHQSHCRSIILESVEICRRQISEGDSTCEKTETLHVHMWRSLKFIGESPNHPYLPSGNDKHNYGSNQHFQWKKSLFLAIFNSYVL